MNLAMLNMLNTNPDMMSTRSDLVDQLEKKGAFYDVRLVDNLWVDDSKATMSEALRSTGRKTVINADLGEVIGVVSDKYVPVLNKDIFDQFNEVLENCADIDLTGAYIEVQTNGNGARIMVEYVLPAHTVQLQNGDEVALRITALNSFDGSTGFKVLCGGIRFACMNGMILGSMISSYHKKHCAGLSIKEAGRVIESGLKSYLNGVDSWNQQINTPISEVDVFQCLAEMADLKVLDGIDYYDWKTEQNRLGNTRITNIDKYMLQYREYAATMFNTQWALNNTLTHIATHGINNNKPSIQSQVAKAEKARGLIKKYLTQS